MKRKTLKTYLSIPVFLGMLALTGQVAADENLVPAPTPTNPTVAGEVNSGVPIAPAPENLPEQGSHTFTERSGVKAEPKVSSPNLDYYEIGEIANYDKTVEAENNLWITYTNHAGSRSYVSVGQLEPTPAPIPVEVPQPAQPTRETVLPASGSYTFEEKTGVKNEPKLSSPDRAFYEVGEKVNYDKTLESDNHLWLSYVNFSGGRSYVAVKELKPAVVAPVSVAVSQPVSPANRPSTPASSPSSQAAFPSSGTYTFTQKTGVKSEAKLSAPDRAFYEVGEKVNYDKTLESDNHLWLSYVNFSGGRSYVAVKELQPAVVSPVSVAVSQPVSPANQPSTQVSSPSSQATFPSSGTYTFTQKTGVKSEAKLSAPDRAFYEVGEKVNYDKTLESDNHLWLSYVNFSGGRSYVAVKELKPAVVVPVSVAVSQPVSPANRPSAQVSSLSSQAAFPSSGTYTFTQKTGVKSEAKLSSPDRAFYEVGEKVNYDKTLESDNHLWLSYVNFSGGRSYVAVKELQPAVVAPVSVAVSQPVSPANRPSTPVSSPSSQAAFPSSGTYTFTQKTGVKSEAKLSAPDRAFYEVGEKVNYDKTLESDNHLWLSYVNFSGGRSYVAVKELKPAVVSPVSVAVSQPVSPANRPSTPASSPSSQATFLSSGTYTFTQKTGVKSEAKLSAPDRAFYEVGEKVNYDKTLESDNHLWLSYVNFSGGRSYVAVKELKPAVVAPVSVAVSQPVSPVNRPSTPTSSPSSQAAFPSSGTYTFTQKTGVKSEAKLSAPDRAFYEVGEKVNYDKTLESDNHLWLSYVNFSGGRSYVAVKELKPAVVAPVSVAVSQPVSPANRPSTPTSSPSSQAAFPSSGTYTFTQKTGVKSEAKLSAPDRAFYEVGEKVNYDKTLESDNHLWLSYVNFSGGRSYVAVKSLLPQLTAEELKLEEAKKHNAQVRVSDYQENKTSFTVEVVGQEDTKRMTKVRIAVWSAEQGQDDLQWYEPSVVNNKAVAKISIANHSNTSGIYRVQVYTTYLDNQTVVSPVGGYVIEKPSLSEMYDTEAVNSAASSIQKVLQIAGELLGVQGGGAAHKKIVDEYNAVLPHPINYKVTYGDDWCDIFTTVVFQRAGLTHLIGRECGVERHIGIFQNLGIWNEDGATTPKTGDIITFNWDQNRQANNGFADHIAIVTHVENGLIHTIEGNKDNEVKRYSYKIGDGNIRGFARPRYI